MLMQVSLSSLRFWEFGRVGIGPRRVPAEKEGGKLSSRFREGSSTLSPRGFLREDLEPQANELPASDAAGRNF